MSTPIVIRPYDAATDLSALSAIWFAASQAAHPFLGTARLTAQRQLVETVYLPQAETSVACLDGQPVGFLSLLDCFVGGLFVAPGQQGRGIGRQLIAEALARKRSLTLEVYLANAQALRFYTGLGFVELSRRAVDDEGLPFANATLQLNL